MIFSLWSVDAKAGFMHSVPRVRLTTCSVPSKFELDLPERMSPLVLAREPAVWALSQVREVGRTSRKRIALRSMILVERTGVVVASVKCPAADERVAY